MSINDSISVAVCISMEVTSDVFCGNIHALEVNHLVAIFAVPVAIVPEWVEAACIAPVAVIVLGVICTTSVVANLVAFEPFVEGIDLIECSIFTTAIAVPVAVVPVGVFTAQSVLIAVVVVTIWILIIAVR